MKILKEYNYKGYDIEYPMHGGAYGVTVARGGRVVREFADEHDAEEWIDEEVGDNESLNEDTVKTSNGKWTNKGKEGTHGKFKTKKQADAQRKAMFANGYKAESKDTLDNESLNEASKLDIIKSNKKAYQDVENYIKKVKDPLEKDVYQYLILKWLSNNNWIGGMSDSAFQKQYEKYLSNYSEDEVMDKYDELIGKFDSNNNFIESLDESLGDDLDKLKQDLDNMQIGDSVTVKNYKNGDIYKFKKLGNSNAIGDFVNVLGKNHMASKQHVLGWAKESLIYAKYPPKFEFKESLTEDLSPEEVGASSVFNDLIQKEYDLLSQYDSVQITLEDNGDSRFSEIFEYIKDDINIHIGMLQSCLEDLNGSEEQNAEGEQKADQLLNLDESLFD